MSRVHRWEGHATALSSISHGGDALGTTTYLRRETFLTPQGRLDIPVISGNALRGVLRDHAAHLFMDALGNPRLPMAVMHALWSGGALVKAKSQPLTGQRLADLRRMVPFVGVFGTAGGGRILDSALTVGKMIPACAQTAHILPEPLTREPLPDLHDLLQLERYVRVPDHHHLTAENASDGPDSADPDSTFMRYGTETFVTGTRFHARIVLSYPTAAELAFFTEALQTWIPDAVVGGKKGRGLGRVRFDFTDTPDVNFEGTDWRTFGGASRNEVLTALSWLD